jgi:hypothetical protein
MSIASQALGPVGSGRPLARTSRLVGQVVYLYAFDVAYEMLRRPLETLLGQPVAQFMPDASKRNPRQLFFFRPQMVRLPPVERLGPRGAIRLERSIKLLPVGAISIMVRAGFEVAQLDDLVAFHDLRFLDGSHLDDEVRRLAEEVRLELASYFIRPVPQLGDEEAYTIFCIDASRSGFGGRKLSGDGEPQIRSEDWLATHRREIAALLTQEPHPELLSDQEAEESTSKYFSYYDQDLVVVDWDAALVVDQPRHFDEVLYIMELANVQLAELEAYDRILDQAVDRSYRDLAARRFAHKRTLGVQRELREIRIDLARLSDELSNITKFFGDWHLARIYQGVAGRFHLADWHRTIDEKLKTMYDLYQLLRADQNNRWMLILELTIVLLFIIDLVILVIGPG